MKVSRLLEVAGPAASESEVLRGIVGVAEMEAPSEIEQQPLASRAGDRQRCRFLPKRAAVSEGSHPPAWQAPIGPIPLATATAAGASSPVFSRSRRDTLFISASSFATVYIEANKVVDREIVCQMKFRACASSESASTPQAAVSSSAAPAGAHGTPARASRSAPTPSRSCRAARLLRRPAAAP